jgi:hypothetical protein
LANSTTDDWNSTGVQSFETTSATPVLIDNYAEGNYTGSWPLNVNHPSVDNLKSAGGQSFTTLSSNYKITSCKFYLRATGTPAGNAHAVLYIHSGTYGTSSKPTGSALATSDDFDISTVATGSFALYTLNFTGAEQYTMQASTYYCIVFQNPSSGIDGDNFTDIGLDASTPSHSGNSLGWTGDKSWFADASLDAVFYVYGTLNADALPPTYSSVSVSSTVAGTSANFSCYASDNVGLGNYIFETNNTGTPTNDTIESFTSNPSWMNVTKTLNGTVGVVIQYIWRFNDTSNNWNNTVGYLLTTANATTYGLTINSTPISVTYDINGTSAGFSVYAATGSVSDINAAIAEVIVAGGGTVYIPVGDWVVNQSLCTNSGGGAISIDASSLPDGAWLNIIGSYTNTTITTQHGVSISGPSTILRSSKANDGTLGDMCTFYVKNSGNGTNRHVRISGLTILGWILSESTNNEAIWLNNVDTYRIDHCYLDSSTGADIVTWKSKGVIDHCILDQTYHTNSSLPSWGYGVAVYGASQFGSNNWILNPDDIIGRYDWQYKQMYCIDPQSAGATNVPVLKSIVTS